MKKTTFLKILPLLASSIAALHADTEYIWNPGQDISGLPENMGGSGLWDLSRSAWWDGEINLSAGGAAAQFGNTTGTPGNATLNFYNSGTVERTFTAQFVSLNDTIHTLNFASGSNYDIIGIRNGTSIGQAGLLAEMHFNIASDAKVSFSTASVQEGEDKIYHYLQSAWNRSTRDKGFTISGGGQMILNDGMILRAGHESTRLNIIDGSTLTFNTGSFYTGGTAGNLELHRRINIESGTVNVNGGTLYTGYYGSGTGTNSARSAIIIGGIADSEAAPSELNISDGTVYALGDPRNVNGAGIIFGNNISGNNGGTVNLTGGTLVTTGIRANGQSAKLNIDGGTIVVSTDIMGTDAPSTDAQIQTRLDNFIVGATLMNRRGIYFGGNGATFDTGSIDTTKTNGIATISSNIDNLGDAKGVLIKQGANTLMLAGANRYTGAT